MIFFTRHDYYDGAVTQRRYHSMGAGWVEYRVATRPPSEPNCRWIANTPARPGELRLGFNPTARLSPPTATSFFGLNGIGFVEICIGLEINGYLPAEF